MAATTIFGATYKLLKDYYNSQDIVRLILKSGTEVHGPIMEIDTFFVSIAPVYSLSPKQRCHDDIHIRIDEVAGVGISPKHYEVDHTRE